MPFFNGAIVIKKLQNMMNIIFRKTIKIEWRFYLPGYSHFIKDTGTNCMKVFQQDVFSSTK